jgi:hypothetical protein
MGYKSKFKGAEIDARLEKMVNVTYAELVALRDEGKLIAGQMYRMTDYETTCTWENTQVAGHPFDLVLTALDNKTLDEKCSAIWSERDKDGYFANSNLPAWDVRYCLDNDKERFDWAKKEGKYIVADQDGWILEGVLNGTYVLDGVTYKKWDAYDSDYHMYILTLSENPKEGEDCLFCEYQDDDYAYSAKVVSVEDREGGKGIIYRLVDDAMNSIPYDFKNIMFSRPLTEGEYDLDNGVDTFCYTFSHISEDDLSVVSDGSIQGLASGNTLEGESFDNVFFCRKAYSTAANQLSFGCQSNTFMYGASGNYIGSGICLNFFDRGFWWNNVGSNLMENTFGRGIRSCVFGDDCIVCSFCSNIINSTFGNQLNSVLFEGETTSSYWKIQYYHASALYNKEVTLYGDRNYVTYITQDKNGNVVEYTVDDIK